MRARSVVLVTIVAVALLSGAAIAFGGSPVNGTVTLNASDGPAVSVQFASQSQLDTTSPFPDNPTPST
jgi:hypothetical protein